MDHQDTQHAAPSLMSYMERFAPSESDRSGGDAPDIQPSPANSAADHPFPEILELVDPSTFSRLQFSLELFSGNVINHNPITIPVRGRGGSYVVRRISFQLNQHKVGLDSGEARDPKYVVVKKPIFNGSGSDEDILRLRVVLLELKILLFKPISQHPNIVRLLQFRWDTQAGDKLVAPSLVLEYADLGSLANLQNPENLSLRSSTKKAICLDIARGLQALHSHGIVHGDIKSE
jgi:serine/threonine protein kinase